MEFRQFGSLPTSVLEKSKIFYSHSNIGKKIDILYYITEHFIYHYINQLYNTDWWLARKYLLSEDGENQKMCLWDTDVPLCTYQ